MSSRRAGTRYGKIRGVLDLCGVLSNVRAANVAVVPAAVSRRVLPLVYDEALAARSVVEEERGHRAGSRRVTGGSEMSVDEGTGRAASVRAGSSITKRTH